MFKALLVGAGGMGKAWGRNLKDHGAVVRTVGWVDVRPDAASAAADELELAGIYTGADLKQAIAETKPDFVVDVTIPEAHRDVTLTALAAGVPVIGEKPMAHSIEAAREMVAASEKAGKLYMVSQSRRYNNNLRAYKRLIDDRIGGAEILKFDFFLGAHFGGFRDEMEHVYVLDMAIHHFDMARYLTGLDAVDVYCDEFNPTWSWYKGDACASAVFTMQGNRKLLCNAGWCTEGRHTPWDAEWRAVGPKGTATWDGDAGVVADIVTESDGFFSKTEAVPGVVEDAPSGIAGSLAEFLEALRTGKAPMGECHDNIKSLAMVFSAIESAQTGQRVPVRLA